MAFALFTVNNVNLCYTQIEWRCGERRLLHCGIMACDGREIRNWRRSLDRQIALRNAVYVSAVKHIELVLDARQAMAVDKRVPLAQEPFVGVACDFEPVPTPE